MTLRSKEHNLSNTWISYLNNDVLNFAFKNRMASVLLTYQYSNFCIQYHNNWALLWEKVAFKYVDSKDPDKPVQSQYDQRTC